MTEVDKGRPGEERPHNVDKCDHVSIPINTDGSSTPAPRFHWELGLRRTMHLDSTAKLIGYALATWSTTKTGGEAFPGISNLSLATDKSQSTVQRALKRLRERGWIILCNEAERQKKRYLASEYQLAVPNAYVSLVTCSHGRPLFAHDAHYRSPVNGLDGTHDAPPTHDLHKTISSVESAASEPLPLQPTPSETAPLSDHLRRAAEDLARRHATKVDLTTAIRCVIAISEKPQPPINLGAYVRSFTAEDVLAHAQRVGAAEPEDRTPAEPLRHQCSHGYAMGADGTFTCPPTLHVEHAPPPAAAESNALGVTR